MSDASTDGGADAAPLVACNDGTGCPQGTLCHAVGTSGQCHAATGASCTLDAGTCAVGGPPATSAQCASGQCVRRYDPPTPCTDDDGCDPGFFCWKLPSGTTCATGG